MAMLATVTGPKSSQARMSKMCFVFDQLSKVYLGLDKMSKLACAHFLFSGGHTSLKNMLNAKEVNLFCDIHFGDNLLSFNDLPRFDLIVNCLSCPDHDAKGLSSFKGS